MLQIGPGAKRLVANPGQDDHAHIRIVMRHAITSGDAGDHVAIDGVALLRPVDGDPERLPALFQHHAVAVSHCPARLVPLSADINGRMAADCKEDLSSRVGTAAFFTQTLLSWNAAPPIG